MFCLFPRGLNLWLGYPPAVILNKLTHEKELKEPEGKKLNRKLFTLFYKEEVSNMWKKFLKRLRSKEQGITGLETAIILIAFVIVASVFAYVVLSAGLFSG